MTGKLLASFLVICGLAGGIGIDWDKFIIDYAFLPSAINGIFANHHLISLSIYLDWVLSKIKVNKK